MDQRPAISRDDLERHSHVVRSEVARICRRIPANASLREDLEAAGMAGLLDALQKMDGLEGEFEWYARVRVRGALLDELRKRDWATRGMRAAARRACADGEEGSGSRAFSLTLDSDMLDELASATLDSPLDVAERRSEGRVLAQALQQLPERDGAVVRMHYFDAVPFHEIAKALRVTPARVSQLHARALRGLRERLCRVSPSTFPPHAA